MGTGTDLSDKDRQEFKQYLRACTDSQVQGVLDTEHGHGREVYAALAEAELERRGIYQEPS